MAATKKKEFIDDKGYLRVPMSINTDVAPLRAGWDQFYCVFSLNRKNPLKWFVYKPIRGYHTRGRRK